MKSKEGTRQRIDVTGFLCFKSFILNINDKIAKTNPKILSNIKIINIAITKNRNAKPPPCFFSLIKTPPTPLFLIIAHFNRICITFSFLFVLNGKIIIRW